MNNDIIKALQASAAIYDAVRSNIREGVSEQELYDIVGQTAGRLLEGHEWEYIGDFISGERTGAIEGAPTERCMKKGDLFLMDLSLRCDSGWCDTCRTFFLGEPTKEQRRAYDAVLCCQRVGEQTVRAGVKAADIKRVMETFMVSRGYGGLMPHHGGHAVGDEPFYKPVFELESDMCVDEGMVITLEPGLYFENRWGIRVENNYLVTEDGLVNLFDYPREIDYFVIEGEHK